MPHDAHLVVGQATAEATQGVPRIVMLSLRKRCPAPQEFSDAFEAASGPYGKPLTAVSRGRARFFKLVKSLVEGQEI